MDNYTKGDWRVDQVAGGYNIWLHLCPEKDPAKWDRIARVGGELSKTKEIKKQAKANAERICQCVNNFDDLLDACKEGLAECERVKLDCKCANKDLSSLLERIDKLEQAIQKAKV